MNKIYGYKDKDIVGLIKFIDCHKDLSLTEIFEFYGKSVNKAKGTVRNLYYAVAKKCGDESFRKEFLGGKAISINKIVSFTDEEEKALVEKVVLLKSQGYSVRKAVLSIADGDEKLALRYQNKYRNILSNNPELIINVAKTLKEKGFNIKLPQKKSYNIPDGTMKELKREINNLVARIGERERQENIKLRERIARLEGENIKLSRQLYGGEDIIPIKEYFKGNINKKVQN